MSIESGVVYSGSRKRKQRPPFEKIWLSPEKVSSKGLKIRQGSGELRGRRGEFQNLKEGVKTGAEA